MLPLFLNVWSYSKEQWAPYVQPAYIFSECIYIMSKLLKMILWKVGIVRLPGTKHCFLLEKYYWKMSQMIFGKFDASNVLNIRQI